LTFPSLVRAIAVSVLVLRPAGTDVWAQTPVQAGTPQKEWAFDEVVRAAISQHPLVEAAQNRITAARGSRQTAGSFGNPVATYWMDSGAFPGPSSTVGTSRETSTYVTVPLEPFFQRAPRIHRADADVRSAEIALLAARREVALDAARVFYRVALAQVSLEVFEENRRIIERLVSYNQSRVTEGATAEVELIRVQVELDRAATNVALAEVDLGKSQAELWPFLSAEAPSGALAPLKVTVPSGGIARTLLAPVSTFVSRARERRSEVLGADAHVSAATAETAVQHALTIRQIGATFGFKRTGGENSMIAGLSVPVPLFDRNRGEVQRATGELLAARQELAWTERTVAAEVEGDYYAAERLSSQVSALAPSFLDRADEANRITLAAYQEGAATLLQVLDAGRALADARLTYSRAVLAQRESLFDLAMASGDEPETALNALARSDGLLAREAAGTGDQQR
jgi:cobalt-zinc-cadmium efflux system outer membrane protein